jgi:hypothetical protein
MQRWFAVAISVGFATTLVHMKWLNGGRMPTFGEWQQLARLAVALTTVLLSWEGYFFSIAGKPLTNTSRFVIDFVLVLMYMVLLYTSKIPAFWLYIHAVSFLLYVIWDLISIKEYRSTYVFDGQAEAQPTTGRIYLEALRGTAGFYRGPIITLAWGIYFAALAASQQVLATQNAFVLAPFALAGLIAYRHDKTLASAAKQGGYCWGTSKRLSLILLLIVGLIATAYLTKRVC